MTCKRDNTDIADEIFVINVGVYIGFSTRPEIEDANINANQLNI